MTDIRSTCDHTVLRCQEAKGPVPGLSGDHHDPAQSGHLHPAGLHRAVSLLARAQDQDDRGEGGGGEGAAPDGQVQTVL